MVRGGKGAANGAVTILFPSRVGAGRGLAVPAQQRGVPDGRRPRPRPHGQACAGAAGFTDTPLLSGARWLCG